MRSEHNGTGAGSGAAETGATPEARSAERVGGRPPNDSGAIYFAFWPWFIIVLAAGFATWLLSATWWTGSAETSFAFQSSTFTAVEDTTINSKKRDLNYGQRPTVQADWQPGVKRILLHFHVDGIPADATITLATLQLYVTNSSDQAGTVHQVSGHWSEAYTTWFNAPPVGPMIAALEGRPVITGRTQGDVSSAVEGNGDVDFYVVTTSANGVDYASRESSAEPPTLTVEWLTPLADGATPGPTSTPTPAASPTPTASPAAAPVATQEPAAPLSPAPTPTPPPSLSSAPSSGFVTANGRSLYLAGSPYTFVGVNRYNLITIDPPGSAYQGCGGAWSEAELASWFTEVRNQGVNAVRFWAFQRFTANGTDFARLDYLLSLAEQHNVKVIPTFENQWQDCTEGGYKRDTWYASGYLSPYGSYTMSFRDYVGVFVNRYKNDDRILMWQLMNEAEIKTVGGQCGDPQTLKNFAADVSAYIKSIDNNHLVNIGTMGGGQCGAQGSQFKTLHDIPTVDLCEFHDYNSPSDPMPGDQWNGLQTRFDQCNALNKPLFIGEAGIKSNCSDPDCYTQQQRADLFNAKMAAFYDAGGVGYAIWSYRDWDGIDPPWTYDAADPLAQVTGRY